MSTFEFSWLAFGFAVANFFILAALLYRFLHKPLLAVLEKRSAAIEKARNDAAEEHKQARTMRTEYERKQEELARERDQVLTETRRSAEQAGKQQIDKAKADGQREAEALKQAAEREIRDAIEEAQDDIRSTVLQTAAAVLSVVADDDIDARLNTQLLEQLDTLQAADGSRSRHVDGRTVRVVSARELDKGLRERIRESVVKFTGGGELTFDSDASLVAGTRVEFTDLCVDASLADILSAVEQRAAEQPAGKPTGDGAA